MGLKTKATPFALSALSASAIIFLLNISIGSYFESYEILFQQFMLETACYAPKMALSVSHFGLVPLYAQLTALFPNIPVFSSVNTIYNILILTGYIYLLYLLVDKGFKRDKRLLAIGSILLMTLFINLVYINNVRIALLSTLLAYLYLFVQNHRQLSKRHYLLFILYLVIGLEIRQEMAIIVSVFATVFFIFWGNRKQIIITGISLMVGLVLFISLSQAMYKSETDKYYLHQAEHIMHDRDNYKPEITSIQDSLHAHAVFMYIHDKPQIDISDYEAISKQENLFEYIFQNDDLLSIYGDKLVDIALILKSYAWLLLIGASLLVLLFMSTQNTKDRFKIALLVAMYLGLPLGLNLLVFVAKSFLIAYLSIGVLALCIYFILADRKVMSKGSVGLIILIPVGILFINNLRLEWQEIQANTESASYYQSAIKSYRADGKEVIFAWPKFETIYSARLFASKKDEMLRHRFLHEGFMGYYDTFLDYNEAFYGENHENLLTRVERITKHDVVFFSDEYQNSFLKAYMSSFYGLNLQFEQVSAINDGNFEVYEVSIN